MMRRSPLAAADDEELRQLMSERRDQWLWIGALYLAPFAGIMFLWFIAVIRVQLGEREDRFFAIVFFGSGADCRGRGPAPEYRPQHSNRAKSPAVLRNTDPGGITQPGRSRGRSRSVTPSPPRARGLGEHRARRAARRGPGA